VKLGHSAHSKSSPPLRFLPSPITAVHSMRAPALERFDKLVHSNTPASVHHSSVRAPHKERLHPNGIPCSRSSPPAAGPISASLPGRVPLQQGDWGPKIVSLDGQESEPTYSRLAFASPSQESVPIPPARAPSGRDSAQEVVPLRKTPADKLVKSETAATPFAAHPSWHRRQQRTRSGFQKKEL
jgi:hypothetical protein